MGHREVAQPLTTQEAKARLVETAADSRLVEWTRDHPLQGVSVAFLSGLLVGSSADARRAILDALAFVVRKL